MRAIERQGMSLPAAAVVCLLLFAGDALCYGQEPSALNRHLKILYSGRPGSDREKDFVGFLKRYFDVVRTGNLKTFKEADAEGFDVTLLDWDWNAFEEPGPMISEGFSRPVVALGTAGALMCRNWRLKTAYW